MISFYCILSCSLEGELKPCLMRTLGNQTCKIAENIIPSAILFMRKHGSCAVRAHDREIGLQTYQLLADGLSQNVHTPS